VEREKENLVLKSYRLEPSQIEWIDLLVSERICGHTDSAVVRALLQRALDEIVATEFIQKHQAARKAIKK
jgi:hypothetical protein